MLSRFLLFMVLVINLYGESVQDKNSEKENHCQEYIHYEIATSQAGGTYYNFGRDLAGYIARDACIDLKSVETNGSIDNITMIGSPEYDKLKFAIVQSDVLDFFIKKSKEGNLRAKAIVDNLRVITPLFDEEVHIISNIDSKIDSFLDIKGKKLSIGSMGSGTVLTAHMLYKKMFNLDLLRYGNYKYQSFNDALKALDDRSVDAVFIVTGQPIPKLLNPRLDVKLAKYSEKIRANRDIKKIYSITEIKKSSYPWLSRNITTLKTKAYLITFNYENRVTRESIKRFIFVLQEKLNRLKEMASKDNTNIHPKWREVENICNLKLPDGWKLYSVVKELQDSPFCKRIIEKTPPKKGITKGKVDIKDINRAKFDIVEIADCSKKLKYDHNNYSNIDIYKDRERVEKLIYEMFRVSESGTVEDELKFYDDKVKQYFNKENADKRFIKIDRERYRNKWRVRKYKVIDVKVRGPILKEDGKVCYKAAVLFSWRVQSEKKVRTGLNRSIIKFVKRRDKFFIRYVKSKKVSQKGKTQSGVKKLKLKESGITITIEYPESIYLKKYFKIRGKMVNNLDTANSGGLTLSFPQIKSRVQKTLLDSSFNSVSDYTYPNKIYNRDRKRVTAKYYMVEGWESKIWKKGEEKSFTIKFKAPDSFNYSKLVVNIRGILKFKNRMVEIPSDSKYIDQQSFPVKKIYINIKK